ncbi:MAG: class I SAM-dependent methyltransferase [Patescibacteria group bacterium]
MIFARLLHVRYPLGMTYITEYGTLGAKERRQLGFKRRYKDEHPEWDDSMVLLTRFVSERLTAGAQVLDAGCGHGNYVIDELRGRIGRAVGIDADPASTSKNVCLDAIVHGDLESLPFPDGTFDAVVSLWVLEHLRDPVRTFAEIRRVLKPGGFFAFVTPNRHAAIVAARRMMSAPLANRIVRRLYGRDDADMFDVFYRANSLQRLTDIAHEVGFSISELKENVDPSYTSFGPVTYAISSFVSRMRLTLVKPHIIGLFVKPNNIEVSDT